MKKIVFAALAATVFAAPAFAQLAAVPQTSDSIALTGKIKPVCTIDSSASTAPVDLDSTAAQNASTVTIECNGANGSTVTVSSTNNGSLVGPNNAKFAYKVGALGQFVTPTTGGAALAIPANYQFGLSPLTAQIQVGALTGNKYAGAYTDTVTMSIKAN